MRSAPRRKYGHMIDAEKLGSLMDECENWLWDNADVTLDELTTKRQTVRSEAAVMCKDFNDAVEADSKALEEALASEAQV